MCLLYLRRINAAGYIYTHILKVHKHMQMEDNYNRIKEWLIPKLETMDLTIEKFAEACGLTRASVYFYLKDITRPNSTTMKVMCDVLGVPFEEGLRQYTPRRRGRPSGTAWGK